MNPNPESLEDDPRILQVSREYLADLEAGRTPDREAYLNRYPELSEWVEECLDGIDLAQSLRPANVPQVPDHHASPLGDFQIIREIGRGGMGVVYEATQLSLGRKVALKVLPFAAALDAKHLQRFKTEAYAAAQLHHTNIVPVYAVGCERGMHFYAMQLIPGRSLADVISELRRENATTAPRTNESWVLTNTVAGQGDTVAQTMRDRSSPRSTRTRDSFRSAARLAADIADALEYAHDAGVIHRDIKPANLLLDAKGAVWVTDFGLAQVASDASLTQTGDLLGTLRYMSPEQAAGRRQPVDHRTDVYSLGATLYELLTLQPLFPGQDRAALLHQILHDDPRPLRKLDLAIPVELETIVLKSLAKSPAERYATAGEMAADLRRFLSDVPIRARRPQLVDRVRKWMRRHPAVVGTAVVLLVCGTIGLGITTAIVAHEHSKTEQAYYQEQQRAREAEAQFKLARRVADEMIQLAEEELSNDNPFQEGLRKRLLEAALGYYQEFIENRGVVSVSEAELEVTRDRVKKILADLALLQADRQRFLLREVAVLDDLQLTAEQRVQIAELNQRQDELRRGLGFGHPRGSGRDFGPKPNPPREGEFEPGRSPDRERPPRLERNPDRDPGQQPRRGQDMDHGPKPGLGPDRGPGGGPPPELRGRPPNDQQNIAAARANDAAYSAILTPEQSARLSQIALQCQGPMAFKELDIARTLRLTANQKESMRDVEREVMSRAFERFRTEPPTEEVRDRLWKEMMQKVLAVLTPTQRQQWEKMTGKPFLAPLTFPRHGIPFGPGPHRGGPPNKRA